MLSATRLDQTMFRKYDIRGVADVQLTAEVIKAIGQAVGSMIMEQHAGQVAVARDGRSSGPLLLNALIEGLLATGCNVTNIGVVPTPLLYYAAATLPNHSGIMLTGSHNPANYNGLKMVINGHALTEAEIKSIYERIAANQFCKGRGRLEDVDLASRYQAEIAQQITLKRKLKIVIDAGNGVTGVVAPALFRQLGCDVHELFCEIDGSFPNHHPDPSQIENLDALRAEVVVQNADIGLAFDGDGDRIGVVTNKGEVIWPDRLLMLYAQSMLSACPGGKVIYDVKCTQHLAGFVLQAGGEPLMYKTGHSFIKAKMAETNAELAGEMSGHFFFKDRWYGFDDAMYAGARLLETVCEQTQSVSELFAAIPNSVSTPELKIDVPDAEKFELMQSLVNKAQFSEPHDIQTIDGLRVNFSNGWGLVRPSNTTPCLVLRFEAIDAIALTQIQSYFRAWLHQVKPDLLLPF